MRGRKLMLILILLTLLTGIITVGIKVQSNPGSVRVYVDIPDSYIPGKPVGTRFYINISIESPPEWENTSNGIIAWTIYVKVFPSVLEPLTVKGAVSGYFLYDFIAEYGYTGHEPNLLKIINETEGLFSDVTESIMGWKELGVGAGGNGTLCSLRVRSLNETAYSRIDILEAYYYTQPDGERFPVDIVEDGHYNEPVLYPPTASFTYSPSAPIVGETVTFDASASSDIDGFIVSYLWDFGDDSPPVNETDPITTHIYTSNGTYLVNLTVTDNDGLNDTTAKTVTVSDVHDVAVDSVALSATEVYLGQLVNINVTVKNEGTTAETFDVTVYRNDTAIGTKTVTDLAAGANLTLTFTWSTAGVPIGTYVIKAEASVVPGETDTADNVLTDGTVRIKITDANGDGLVNAYDLAMLGKAYGTVSGEPHYDPNVDFDGDGKVDSSDFILLACNWGYSE